MNQQECTYSVNGNVKLYMHFVKQIGSSLKYYIYTSIWQSNSTCTQIFIAALFSIAQSWRQPRISSTDVWINKIVFNLFMKYYSPITKNELLIYTKTCMNLKGMPIERNNIQKDTFIMIPFIWNFSKYKSKMQLKERKSVVACGWEDFLGRKEHLWIFSRR